jgi:hypothetical protein
MGQFGRVGTLKAHKGISLKTLSLMSVTAKHHYHFTVQRIAFKATHLMAYVV